tara:strand:+ start:2394 stop:2732 length:339 start_codon:yes stop_codon:yes gene_type:complete
MENKQFLDESSIAEKVRKRLETFENCDATKKWVTSVENRGKYQRDIDLAFFKEVKEMISTQARLIILLNINQVGHLMRYEETMRKKYLSHETKILEMYKDIVKLVEDYGNRG